MERVVNQQYGVDQLGSLLYNDSITTTEMLIMPKVTVSLSWEVEEKDVEQVKQMLQAGQFELTDGAFYEDETEKRKITSFDGQFTINSEEI